MHPGQGIHGMPERLEISAHRTRAVSRLRVLIVDDDRFVRVSYEAALQVLGTDARSVGSAQEALRLLSIESFDLVLLDIHMPGLSGMDALDSILSTSPCSHVVMMTGLATVESAVEALKKGAWDYIRKPLEFSGLSLLLKAIQDEVDLADTQQWHASSGDLGLSGLVGASGAMGQVFNLIGRAAGSSHPVLILGETGTGRTTIARAIHKTGLMKDRPFLVIEDDFNDVGTLLTKWRTLGGTLLLEEVGNIPSWAQASVARAMEDPTTGELRRIIATSSQELSRIYPKGQIRQDLYLKLSVLILRVPALRERPEDIPCLVEYFLNLHAAQNGRKIKISSSAMRILKSHKWPGNVLQLRNCVEAIVANASSKTIGPMALPKDILQLEGAETLVQSPPTVETLAETEKRAVLAALQHTGGDKLKAARLLGIGRATLYRKLAQHGSEWPS